MNIFVGNLTFSATEADVKKLFEGFGSVTSASIVMEKKGTKSRGFGFVEMPDEQQALVAISALNDKDFMGRPLRVSPARPKHEVAQDKGQAKKIFSGVRVKGRERLREEGAEKRWYNPVFNKEKGGYKKGRRSRSFMKRRVAAGIAEEAAPKGEIKENPMRWRKNYGQPKPWQKTPGKNKPWKKIEGEFRPREKREGEPKPFKRKEGTFNPRKKSAGESKSWRKSGKRPRPRQSRIQSRRKPGGYSR